ncbi:hypothetical protein PRUPE_6G266800 [Prunus persica]|uniref:Uncharacterized protein n=1 Tax=Prunus persica TaxID=3760 RepID=A0A251NW98_PRUPE|nr:hypothetical protein PRUPE_6G266800 [Prunus persica]
MRPNGRLKCHEKLNVQGTRVALGEAIGDVLKMKGGEMSRERLEVGQALMGLVSVDIGDMKACMAEKLG